MKGKSKSPGGQLYDRLLLPRIDNYALNNDYTDIDELTTYLRRNYKEYQRQKLGPFKNQVSRAVENLTRRGGVSKPEIQLQVLEERHLGRTAAKAATSAQGNTSGSGSSSEGTASGSSSGDDSDSEDSSEAELDGEVAAGMTSNKAPTSMNRSLLSLYGGKTPEPSVAPAGAGASDQEAGDGAERPAFAPPHVVAAAAARAAREAAAAAAAAGAPATSGGSRELPATPAAPSSSAQQRQQQERDRDGDGEAAGAAAGQPAAPASSTGKPLVQAPATSTKAGQQTAAKGKRGGLTPGERTASKRPRTAGARGGGGLGGGVAGSTITAPKPVTYADLGGIEPVLDAIKELIEYPLKHPEVYGWLGVEPPRGVLLHGPPGCGKTALANAIANECGVPFLRVSAPEVVSGMSGESEAKIRQLFQEAAGAAPCIVFIDEIDAIAPKRETAQREMERRIVAQMLTCLDDLSGSFMASQGKEPPAEAGQQGGGSDEEGRQAVQDARRLLEGKHVVVIGATNRPDSLDPALRRAGRFDREIALGIPSEEARCKILQVLAQRLRLAGDFDFRTVAKRTPGYVGADLQALCKEAAALAVKRIFTQLEQQAQQQQQAERQHEQQQQQPLGTAATPEAAEAAAGRAALAGLSLAGADGQELIAQRLGQGPLTATELSGLAITMSDFEEAIGKVQPSVRREGFATTPDVTWDDVGSLNEVREELSFAITQPIAHPQMFEAMGLQSGTGVLLFGPPGCGKTLVAKAVANESGANFISIKGPELLNKYVGESERAVRQLFTRARAAAPCVLFFDEMDALAPRRGSDVNQSSERVVNQLLTEMDGVDGREGVYLVAATNRPDMIDPALLRPGRLDKMLYVPLPPPDGRVSILQALSRKTPLAGDVDMSVIGMSARLTGFSGADLAALVREACVCSLKESMTGGVSAGGVTPQVTMRHFELAMQRVQPSVSRNDQRMYDALRLRLRSSRGHLQPEDGAQPSEAPGITMAAGGVPVDGPQDMEGSADNVGAAPPDNEEPMEAEPEGVALS
ncbi:hypothetical protein N2152v2_005873 [Parachlorella kessleri]